eukprot:TRINITY_DN38354_c0_g1_i1.p1 TRINITY_DN38354_c0_g1~~TRINITY_DN38354_c0_g1_i1.p1  ORF type:complete len:205 (+),score=23.76 TRINITY_DN38354_c0_g1_i1:49-663(+)
MSTLKVAQLREELCAPADSSFNLNTTLLSGFCSQFDGGAPMAHCGGRQPSLVVRDLRGSCRRISMIRMQMSSGPGGFLASDGEPDHLCWRLMVFVSVLQSNTRRSFDFRVHYLKQFMLSSAEMRISQTRALTPICTTKAIQGDPAEMDISCCRGRTMCVARDAKTTSWQKEARRFCFDRWEKIARNVSRVRLMRLAFGATFAGS